MRMFSKSIVAAGAMALGGITLSAAASAMPADGLSAAPLPLAATERPDVKLVSGGCGPFRHRGFNGFCYPNRAYGYGYGFRRPYGYYRPYGFYHRRFVY